MNCGTRRTMSRHEKIVRPNTSRPYVVLGGQFFLMGSTSEGPALKFGEK